MNVERYCYSCMTPVEQDAQFCTACGFQLSAYTPESHHLVPGTLLRERYYVGKVLGEGGFGITYVGIDNVLDRKVAIKEFFMTGYVVRNHTMSAEVVSGTGSYGETFTKNREKFLLEARTLAKFSNEAGIVNVQDFFRENNTAYIVMDFIDGVTLRKYVEQNGKLSDQQMVKILEPVVRSLTNVHEHGLIHRDISPDNIMLTKDGQVKLLDFGAARQVSQGDFKSLSVILKPGYAPEEQYRAKGHQGPWTDVYALCATMYRCITGIVPDDAMERMYNDNVVPPAGLACVCSKSVSDVIMKGMRVRQEERYQSLPELWQALTAPDASEQTWKIETPPETEPVRRTEVQGGSYRIVPPKGKDEAFVWRREEAPSAEPKPNTSEGVYRIVPDKQKSGANDAFVWHREETPSAEPKPNTSEGAYRIVPDKQKNGSNDAFIWHREEPNHVASAPKQQTPPGQKARPAKQPKKAKKQSKKMLIILDILAVAILALLLVPQNYLNLTRYIYWHLGLSGNTVFLNILFDVLIFTQIVQLLTARGPVMWKKRTLQIVLSLVVVFPFGFYTSRIHFINLQYMYTTYYHGLIPVVVLFLDLWISKWVIRSARGGELSRKQRKQLLFINVMVILLAFVLFFLSSF